MTLDCTDVLRYIGEQRDRFGRRITMTSFVGAVTGRALQAEPSLNGRIHLGRFIPYKQVNVAFLVQVNEGENLAQVLVENIDTMRPDEVSDVLSAKATSVRSGQDANFEKSIKLTGKLPTPVLRRVLSFGGFVTTGVGLPFAGQPRFPFGSAVVTSVGMLGIDEAYVPPTPFLRVPLYVAVGSVRDHVFAIDGQPEVRPGLTLTATLDHRFVDGFQAGVLAREVRRYFADPSLFDAPDG